MSKESPKAPPKLDLNDVEMVFGTPNTNTDARPDVHSIANEKSKKDNDLKHKADSDDAAPLLDPARPPLAGPESDLDSPAAGAGPTGVDDGLLQTAGDAEGVDEAPAHHQHGSGRGSREEGATDDGNWALHAAGNDETDFYYGEGFMVNGLGNRLGEDGRPGSPFPTIIPDVNTYQQKKNLAQGMMDLALLSANANQLRYVLESSTGHPYFYPSLVFITCSIILQVAVGVGLIMNSRYNVKDEKDICKADKINNQTVLGIFLITIVNVFITSFSVATPTTVTQQGV